LSLSDSAAFLARKYEMIDPDVRLMLQVQNDNAAAFEELVSRYQSRLVGVMEHLVPKRELAEDLAQEVFLRVYRARKSYVPGAKFSTWLFTIANNVASNAKRSMAKRKEVQVTGAPGYDSGGFTIDRLAMEASGLMPTRKLDRDELALVVREAIQQLNERQKMAMLLSRFEGLSYEEIGKTMGLSVQAIKSLMSRAREKLRQLLEPYVEQGVLGNVPDLEADASVDSES
jgi:RNA polymerase sigma-70 factor (ECF subfamily)